MNVFAELRRPPAIADLTDGACTLHKDSVLASARDEKRWIGALLSIKRYERVYKLRKVFEHLWRAFPVAARLF